MSTKQVTVEERICDYCGKPMDEAVGGVDIGVSLPTPEGVNENWRVAMPKPGDKVMPLSGGQSAYPGPYTVKAVHAEAGLVDLTRRDGSETTMGLIWVRPATETEASLRND